MDETIMNASRTPHAGVWIENRFLKLSAVPVRKPNIPALEQEQSCSFPFAGAAAEVALYVMKYNNI